MALAPDDAAQRGNQTQQPEPTVLEHPVVRLPAQARRQGYERLRDVPTAGQQPAHDELRDRAPCRLRDGQHDLAHPSAQRCREAGLGSRFHDICRRLVQHLQHGSRAPGGASAPLSDRPNPTRTRNSSQLQQAGKILSWGVSNFDVPDLEEALSIAGEGRIACNQVLYYLEERAIEHAVAPWCEKNGVAVVAIACLVTGASQAPAP